MDFRALLHLPLLLTAMFIVITSCEKDEEINDEPSDEGTQEEVSGNIDKNTTWNDRVSDPEEPDYVITSSFEVNADLTIEPGVTVHFEEDVFMNIKDGALIAEGTSDNRITLTSSNEAGGINWGGVYITSSDSRNIIAYADIKYAAGTKMDFSDFKDKNTAIGLTDGGKLKLKHSTISNSDGYGLYGRYGELAEFEKNKFNDNAAHGIGVDMTEAAMIDSNTTFSNNVYAVEIFGSDSKDGDELNYANLSGDASYYVTGDLSVSADITINPGARFEFEQDKKMTILSAGMLMANADGDESIVFTSAKAYAGIYWKGIAIESADARNELNNVQISYAGNTEWDFADFKDKKAALALKTDGQIKLKNTEISNSNGYGVYARYGEFSEFANNTFADNSGTAIGLFANLTSKIDEGTSFTGNGLDGVEIFGSDLTSSATWISLQGSAKYMVSGDLFVQNALTIDPGATFELDVDKKFKVSSGGGSLSAEGTATNKIIFTTSTEGSRWSGIHFRSASSLNKMDYVEVLDAGGTKHDDLDNFVDVYTAVSGDNNATLTITNSKVANSGGFGVYWQDGTTINTDVETANEFTNNDSTNVNIEG